MNGSNVLVKKSSAPSNTNHVRYCKAISAADMDVVGVGKHEREGGSSSRAQLYAAYTEKIMLSSRVKIWRCIDSISQRTMTILS